MITTHSAVYRTAFVQYLRKGTPLEISIKAAAPAAHTTTHYIWHTQQDDRVRSAHAAHEGLIFAWDDPEVSPPGTDYNCRCWAEPLTPDLPPLPLVPEPDIDRAALLAFIVMLLLTKKADWATAAAFLLRRVGRDAANEILTEARKQVDAAKPEPKLDDTTTWPNPSKPGRYKEGLPSRNKPLTRGEKSLYDEEGGEWRYDPGDKYHNPHWNYKPSGKAQEWQNIPIDGLPPRK